MATSSPPKRTQAQRSAATRDALLDATLACLVQDGYAQTTTTRVSERAGLSRGAHLHHFRTRAALMAAAVGRLAERRRENLLAAADRLPSGPERTAAGLDLIWKTYANPLFQAVLDLWTHARTDPELRDQLVPVERELDRQTLEVAERLFPDAAARDDFEHLVGMVVAIIRGLALLDTLHPSGARNRRQWPECRAMLLRLFEEERPPEG